MKKLFKKVVLAVCMAVILGVGLVPMTVKAAAAGDVKITLNGKALTQNNEIGFAVIKDGRTMVPLRLVVESLGFKADWQVDGPKVITMQGQGKTVYHLVGSLQATSNNPLSPSGVNVIATTDVPSYVDKTTGRTMVGLKLVGDAFGVGVKWVSATRTVEITTDFDTPTVEREYTTAEDFYDIVERHADGTLTVKTDAGNLVRIFISNEPVYSGAQLVGTSADIANKRNGFEGVHSFAVELATTTFTGQYVTDASKLPTGISYWNDTVEDRMDGVVGGIVSVDRPDGSHLGTFMLGDYGKKIYILDASIGEYKVTLLEAPYDFKITELGNNYSDQDENGNYYSYASVEDDGHTYGTGFSVVSELPSDY